MRRWSSSPRTFSEYGKRQVEAGANGVGEPDFGAAGIGGREQEFVDCRLRARRSNIVVHMDAAIRFEQGVVAFEVHGDLLELTFPIGAFLAQERLAAAREIIYHRVFTALIEPVMAAMGKMSIVGEHDSGQSRFAQLRLEVGGCRPAPSAKECQIVGVTLGQVHRLPPAWSGVSYVNDLFGGGRGKTEGADGERTECG